MIATPPTVTPEPWASSQPSAPTRSPSRGAPWAPASVRNQPTTPRARHTTRTEDAAAAPPSVASRTSGRRCPGPCRRRRTDGCGPTSSEGAGKSWPGHHRPAPGANRGSHAGPQPRRRFAGPPRLPYRGRGHEESRRVRRVLQGRPRPPAPADLRAHRRPARLPGRGPRLVRRRLAPLAQDLAPGGPRGWARPHAWAHAQRRHTARLWHREKGLDPEDARHPRRARQARRSPSARRCCSPS